ncbi:zinc finger protein Gfi-1b-like isoform X2 [Uranotaenia lowii]|uniref:zinc finger protein Gfi-1b-like isoform X2 n=1 Tax=Uranotaenia lowii TaxID=190385 RepID=UPI002478BF8D|nr:zinc finger protein Gfi-1b-like isoform X2 [Uranotaenia lowii]XP_055608462.1 zinc finger protein Gfi-1b-like isoform X2 [Uranotaenia lowii]
MPTAGDGSPLWGGVQFNHGEMQPMASAASWNTLTDNGTENNIAQSMQFSTYSSYLTLEDHDQYGQTKPESLVDVAEDPHLNIDASVSAYPTNVDYSYMPMQQMALHNMGMMGAPPVPHETVVYSNPVNSTIPNHQSSPDVGYSSPGPDYYGLYSHPPQHQHPIRSQFQTYAPPLAYQHLTPVENVDEVTIKEETTDSYVMEDEHVRYAQEIDSAVDAINEQKFEILEDVVLFPGDQKKYELQQTIQAMGIQQIQSQPHPVFHLLQQAEQPGPSKQRPVLQSKQAVQTVQPSPEQQTRKPRASPKRKQTVVVDDQQPSTSRAPLSTATQTTAFPSVQDEPPTGSTVTLVPRLDQESPMSDDQFNGDEGDDPANRRSARPSAITQSPWECTICGQFFARQCGLSQHKKWIHTPRNFCCEKCGKKFITQEELDDHMIRHDSSDKPFKCEICPKQFCHKNDLRRHTYRHSGAPFDCKLCERRFIRQDHLTSHMITHDKEKRKALKERAKAHKPKKQK